MILGKNIRERRLKLALRGQQLAEMVGVSEPMISLTERELKTPSVAVCAALAQALGCTLDELVFGSADNAGERGDGDESQSPA